MIRERQRAVGCGEERGDRASAQSWLYVPTPLTTVRYVEAIRRRLAPGTGTAVNEIGCISADGLGQTNPGHVTAPIPAASQWRPAPPLRRAGATASTCSRAPRTGRSIKRCGMALSGASGRRSGGNCSRIPLRWPEIRTVSMCSLTEGMTLCVTPGGMAKTGAVNQCSRAPGVFASQYRRTCACGRPFGFRRGSFGSAAHVHAAAPYASCTHAPDAAEHRPARNNKGTSWPFSCRPHDRDRPGNRVPPGIHGSGQSLFGGTEPGKACVENGDALRSSRQRRHRGRGRAGSVGGCRARRARWLRP